MLRLTAILLVAMLGHGLLMTSAAAPACPVRAAAVAAPGPSVHCADHDGGCFTVLSIDRSAARPLALLAAMPILPASQPENGVARWLAELSPGHPPAVARALLQVYRN